LKSGFRDKKCEEEEEEEEERERERDLINK
jgi:hypothetical protein